MAYDQAKANAAFAERLRLDPAKLADDNDKLRHVIRNLSADNTILRARVKELERAILHKENTR